MISTGYNSSYILQEIQKSQFPQTVKELLLSIVEEELKKIYGENLEKILNPHFKRWNKKKIVLWANSTDAEILIKKVPNLKPIGIVEENKFSDVKKELEGIRIFSSWQELSELMPEVIILFLNFKEQEEIHNKIDILENKGIEVFPVYTPEYERNILNIERSLPKSHEDLLMITTFDNIHKIRNRLLFFFLAIEERKIKKKITLLVFGENERQFFLLKEELKAFGALDLEIIQIYNYLHFIRETIKRSPKLVYFCSISGYYLPLLTSVFSTTPLIVDWQDIHWVNPRYLVEHQLLGRNFTELNLSILETPDGIVHHGPDYFVPHNLIEKQAYDSPPTFSFPAYCSKKIYNDNSQEHLEQKLKLLKKGELHLVTSYAIKGGGGRENNLFKMGNTIRIYWELVCQEIHIHYYGMALDSFKRYILIWSGDNKCKYEEEVEILQKLWESPFFHHHEPLLLKEYITESSKYHYGIILGWNFLLMTSAAMALFEPIGVVCFPQKFFTFLAAGLPIITHSDVYHFMYHQIYQNGIGVGLNRESILKAKEVLCDVEQYKKLVERVLKVREKWAIENNIDGLLDFFDRIISMPPRRSCKDMKNVPKITFVDRKFEIETTIKKGEFCEEIGDYKEALNYYEKALNFEPIDSFCKAVLHFRLSKLLAEMGEGNGALRELEKANKSVDMEKIDLLERANFYYNIGSIYELLNELKRAEEEFRKVLKILELEKRGVSLKGGAYFHLGNIFIIMGKKEEGEEYLRRCLELIPTHLKAKKMLENTIEDSI